MDGKMLFILVGFQSFFRITVKCRNVLLVIVAYRAASSIEFYSYSNSAYFSKSEFSSLIIYRFEFDKNMHFRVRVQEDEYPKSRQLFHRRCSFN